jgi:predicted Zn-dependent protease
MTPTNPLFNPSERDALIVLGYLHLEQSRPDEAAALLRPLHRAVPQDAEVERCLAVAELLSGHKARAAHLAAHAYTLSDKSAREAMGFVYAKALWLGGDESGAREALVKVISQRRVLNEK